MWIILSALWPATAATLDVPASYPDVQSAIDAAASGDVVQVEAGTWVGSIDFLGKDIEVRGAGPQDTVLDAAGADTAVRFISGEGSGALLQGFTITGGVAPYYHTGYNGGEQGGGVLIDNASPTLRDLIITDNYADYCAGGVMVGDDAAPLLQNVVLSYNSSSSYNGGGLYADGPGSAPTLENVVFIGNTSSAAGAFMANGGAVITGDHITLLGNGATSPWAEARSIWTYPSHEGFADVFLSNSIVWASQGPNPAVPAIDGDVYADYSLVEGSWPGTGNLDSNPRFAPSGPYPGLLRASSPAVDAGSGADDSIDWCAARPGWCGLNTALPDMGAYGGPGGIGFFD